MRKLLSLTALLLLAPAASWATPDRSSAGTIGDARAGMHGAAPRLYWDNGTRIEFPDGGFTLQINTLLQPRYTYTDASDRIEARDTSSFDLRRARLYVSGTALHNEFSYMLEGEFADFEDGLLGGERRPRLLDAYIDWNACDWGGLRMGQFKPALSRSWNTHPAYLQFLDRTVVSDLSDFGRQQGLGGRVDVAGFELGAALFNNSLGDDGANLTSFDTRHLVVGNVRFNAMGDMNPYQEGDVDWTEDMALNFGGAYAFGNASGDVERHAASVDANFKSRGLSLHGEFFWNRLEIGDVKFKPLGFYAQAGYFLVPRTIELAARYSFVDYDRGNFGSGIAVADGIIVDDINQVSVALNYYWWKHNLKAQIGYDFLNLDQVSGADTNNVNTNRWMLQLSSYF